MRAGIARSIIAQLMLIALLLAGCQAEPERVLRLATTTSTYDSGLLQAILPDFEALSGARIDIVAVGTGQAIAMGERGDADVLMVHDRAKEEAFIEAGYGIARYPLMDNDFVIVGPSYDPAGIFGLPLAAEALAQIAAAEATFVSRGDDSGTHSREMAIWNEAGIQPDPGSGWYLSIGQGMGETLQLASERQAYTLSDRGTFLAMREGLDDLVVLVGGDSRASNPDPSLINFYAVVPVNPEMHPGVAADLAAQFVQWLISVETQEKIAQFGVDRYGQPLFFPDSDPWNQAHPQGET